MHSHEYAALFPMASDAELNEMANDIRQRGLMCPIITLGGKVLDGRNRLRACEIAGVAPRFQEYTGVDPLGDVISWNLMRRHLSTSQKAVLAVALKPMYEEQAKERMRERKGEQPGASMENLPHLSEGTARDQAAAAVGISGRTVQDAENVKKHAPELFEEVKAGRMTVNAARQEVIKREEPKCVPVMSAKQAAMLKPCMGTKFARLAIMDLEQIADDDRERSEAFRMVERWIREHDAET